jgi:hypothetical protein
VQFRRGEALAGDSAPVHDVGRDRHVGFGVALDVEGRLADDRRAGDGGRDPLLSSGTNHP